MRAHPVGERLDEGGALPLAGGRSAARVTARTARTSLPSTRTPGKPKPAARWNSGTRDCRSIGTLIAYWLFWQKKTTGAEKVDAQISASLTSPWLVAPSPRKASTAFSAPSRWMPIA